MADVGPAALDIRDLVVRYGDVLALRGATVRIEAGRVCGLIGMNGSGKSSLFKAIMGAVPFSGTVSILGREPQAARRSNLVGYVPQSGDVDWTFPISIAEVVMMGRYGHQGWHRRPNAADRAAVRLALQRVGLADVADRQVGRLSGGQRKRAFVARCLAQEAAVLLLDEPFAGIDTRSEAEIVDVLRSVASAGRTVLVSTHDLASLPDLCDEAVLLQQRVLRHGPPAAVLTPENLALAFGLGSAGT